jgi:hypothetical protein
MASACELKGITRAPVFVSAIRRDSVEESTSFHLRLRASPDRIPVNNRNRMTPTTNWLSVLLLSALSRTSLRRPTSSMSRNRSFRFSRNFRMPRAGFPSTKSQASAHENILETSATTRLAIPSPPRITRRPRGRAERTRAVFPSRIANSIRSMSALRTSLSGIFPINGSDSRYLHGR